MVVIIATLTFHVPEVLLQNCFMHYDTNVCVSLFSGTFACMCVRRLDDDIGSLSLGTISLTGRELAT